MAKYDDDAAAALAKLKPGAISGVIPLSKDAFAEVMPLGKAGFQIVQLVERKAAQKATLEDSRFQVMNGLMREKEQDIQALLRSLKAKANVQITDAKYQELAQEYQRAKEMTPPAASPGATTPATAPTAPAAGQGSGR
jgi:parvulin-like peptidyl-prolyl isomerase